MAENYLSLQHLPQELQQQLVDDFHKELARESSGINLSTDIFPVSPFLVASFGRDQSSEFVEDNLIGESAFPYMRLMHMGVLLRPERDQDFSKVEQAFLRVIDNLLTTLLQGILGSDGLTKNWSENMYNDPEIIDDVTHAALIKLREMAEKGDKDLPVAGDLERELDKLIKKTRVKIASLTGPRPK